MRKHTETLSKKLAADKIMEHPSSVLKELLENSLNAGSTCIKVTVQDGGLKLLKIQDNGSGINKEDLANICGDFTTSKLKSFEDLHSFGSFRGEVLASISRVAHLTIVTKTRKMSCALRSSYNNDGELLQMKRCAGTKGTQIVVEDLFYNLQTIRNNALKSTSEEHNRLVEVVSGFAVHNPSVQFSLEKLNANGADLLKTPPNSNQLDTIRVLYGSAVAKNLVKLTVEDANLKFKVNGWISNVEYSGTKIIMLLFINNRLVESSQLKTTLNNVYATYLAKGKHPFAYLSIDLAPNCVDVRKHKEPFLNDAIIHNIQLAVGLFLKRATTSLPATIQTVFTASNIIAEKTGSAKLANGAKVYDNEIFQIDGWDHKIDTCLSSSLKSVSSFDSPAGSQSVSNEQSFKLPGEQDKNSSLDEDKRLLVSSYQKRTLRSSKLEKVGELLTGYVKDIAHTDYENENIYKLIVGFVPSKPYISQSLVDKECIMGESKNKQPIKCDECSQTFISKWYF